MASLPTASFPIDWFIRPACCAALPLALALSACGPTTAAKFAPPCPVSGILTDGADLTRFRGAGADLTDMVIDGRITGLSGKCSLDDDTHLRTAIAVTMELARGPASPDRADQVTYFVAVSRDGHILDKQDVAIPVTFGENNDRTRLTTSEVELVLPVTENLSGAAYKITVGFQLTPKELAYNRRRGVR